MKKVRFTVNRGSHGKKFPIFNSPESVYVWLNDPELKEAPRLDPTLGSTVVLRPGETMEVEWLGCEFICEENYVIRIDQIRLAKNMRVKSLQLNNVVGVHRGWTIEEIISFKPGKDTDIKRTRLTGKSKQKFNIEELFVTRGIEEKDEFKLDLENLH